MKHRLSTAVLLLLSLWGPGTAWSATGDPIVSGALRIQGNRLTIYADALTTDADQTVNVGERARVRTCFGGADIPCGSVLPGDPRIAGMLVRGDLSGPEVPQPIVLETVPGGAFLLPGFQQEGDYRLENVRLVDAATSQVLSTAEPSVAILHVRQILLASATVRTLSLAELQARGITFSAENFQAFNFAVGFAFGDQIVKIELPIVYSGYGTVQPLDKPKVILDGLPSDVAHAVARWQPPQIIPFKLEQPDPGEGLRAGEEEDEDLKLPLFGAIVLPGTVSYLNQFFEARLVVANGAPAGSTARLEQIQASLRLPPLNVLRMVSTSPSVASGQAVPVTAASGARILFPGEQGTAAWTVEGLAAGSHTLQMDINANLARPGRDPFPLMSRIQAAIEVVDARFNLTFSHPDVVREGEGYSLFVTVTNLSRAAQNLITVDLDEQHLTGAHRADPADTLRRTIDTLAPGQAETLEFRLISDLDGKVVATTFQSTSLSGVGTIHLRTGVGELGIPLSPATLILPRFSERLKTPFLASDDLLRAETRFLGLAYSLAVAPAALTPQGLPRVIKSDVERRAIDFAEAGLRTYLHEPLLESLEVLALDSLGNRLPLAEIDELRRGTGKGLAVASEIALLMRAEQASRNLSAKDLFDQLAATTTYTDPYVAALLIPASGSEALTLEVQGQVGGAAGTLKGAAADAGALRSLAYGEIFPVRRAPGLDDTAPLAVVGHVELAQELVVVVRNPGTQPAHGNLLLVVPAADGREDRRIELPDVTVPPGGGVAMRVGAGIASPVPVDAASGAPVGSGPSIGTIARPPFRLIGAVQDFRLKEEGPDLLGNMHRPNRYGNGMLYLFNRPPGKDGAENPANFRIRSTFQGLDTAGQAASGTADKLGTGAWVQDDARVVAVRYATPVSALINPANGAPLLNHQHLLESGNLLDAWGQTLDAGVPAPSVETLPVHFGGLVTGKVVRGTGEPVAGARVQLIRPLLWETLADTVVKLDFLGEVTTGSDGVFFFDFIENPSWDRQVLPSFTLRAIIPAGANPALQPEEVQEVGSTLRLQNRMMRINIALLGRGTVRGRVVYADDGSPVTTGTVRASSTLFNEEKSAVASADGSFSLSGVPVGPITITARDVDQRVVYATVGVAAPGDTVDAVLRMPRVIPGLGSVTGTLTGATSGAAITGARVAVFSQGAEIAAQETDDFGRFRFDNVPAGQVSLQAANWKVSRLSVFTDLVLAAGETKQVDLRLPEGASRVVTGSVFFHDPATNTNVPVQGAAAFIAGPGVFAYSDAAGRYRIEGVPVQGANESYTVKAIDFNRKLEGSTPLPPILDVSPDVVEAQSIVLQSMSGGVDGVVLDPLGRPLGGAEVVLYPYGTTTSQPDGSFAFENLPVGGHSVTAHVGDGLQAGREGYFGDADASIVYGGHRPFATVRMRGAGIVNILTRTATATGILTPIYYKPTYYSGVEYRIRLKGAYIQTTTDPNGRLQLTLPVGPYEIVAYNPFHGIKTLTGTIDYAGQVVSQEVVFEDAATVTGQVVGVDGVTPVPDIEVTMEATGLKGQTQRTDAQGRFMYELVPLGRAMVSADGLAGGVARVGRTIGYVGTAGQTLDLVVQMKAQGTVTGRVMENFNGTVRPLSHAFYYLQENSFPFRRLPEDGAWLVTDSVGNYQVPHIYAGNVTVVARDSGQVGRFGSASADLTVDWQVLQMPDIVMTTSVGSLQLVVRNPASGGPVADVQVRLSNNEATVTGADGVAFFDALPLGSYSVYAFYAPTGQSGRLSDVQLTSPGQLVARTVYLDQRGDVLGTLWDDAAKTKRVPGGTVRLEGQTAGGRVTALATTADAGGAGGAAGEGRFQFLGIPEGTFTLEAALPTSPRRASATAAITATSPIVDVNLIFEEAGDRYFQLFEKLKAGTSPVSLTGGLFSTRLTQTGYDYAQLAPVPGSDRFLFPGVLLSRSAQFAADELTGERRGAAARFNDFVSPAPLPGAGSLADPYQLVLSPKGVVRVAVRDPQGRPFAGANVTLNTAAGVFPSVSGADGTVTFAAVPSGALNATATSLANGTSGYAAATLTYDDDLIEMTVTLSPAVAAHGIVYLPVPDDRWNGDPAVLVPAPGILVQIRDARGSNQLVLTDDHGAYRFAGLPVGGYQITARNNNGDQQAALGGTLFGPDGNDNLLPAMILDASPPRLLTIAPPPGFEGVSRTAAVELVFSEPLDPAVLPVNSGNPAGYFSLRSSTGASAPGTWTSSLDATGRQVVRFTPSVAYDNFTVYSLTVTGGSGGVRDRTGRPLTAFGNVGSNFKTSDSVGPAVIGTDPDLSRPIDPQVPIRFDFSEAVHATDEQLDGDLSGDAAQLFWEASTGSGTEWRPLPVTMFLTRSNYSLVVQAVQGVSLAGDTLRRRIVLSGLTDVYGNLMPAYEKIFRLFDSHAPVIDAVPYPPPSTNGQLLQGTHYTIVPALSRIDDVTAANPGGDVDRVDYFFSDPADPSHPVSAAYSAKVYPFSYSFIGAYSGDGRTPHPFPVWVRAVDTSTNKSNVVLVSMVVLPNTDPSIESAAVVATAPVPGIPYAGSSLQATVGGFYDLDGSQLTLFAELWQEGAASPLATAAARQILRPASGWNDAPSQTFTFKLPLTLAEGTRLYARARVLDSNGAVGVRESERFAVADDATPAVIDDFSARRGGAPASALFIGDDFLLEVRAHDGETAIKDLTLTIDRTDLFPGPLVATKVVGTADLYRTSTLTVPPGFTGPITVTATAQASDYGGNSASRPVQFTVSPAHDPYAPVARWLLPWQGGLWPAGYTSTVSAADGAALLLRFYARDTNADADGNPIPGKLVTVEVRGPVRNAATGALELPATWTTAVKVPGTEDLAGAVYQAMWRVPNGIPEGTEIPFESRLVDAGSTETINRVTLTAVAARRVYEAALTSVAAADTMLAAGGNPDGPVFLLDGTTLSILPQPDRSVRRVSGLFLYTGASTDSGSLVTRPTVLTAPEITTYDSAVLFNPLELAVDSEVGVALESRVDMTGKGLLGSTSTRSMVLTGETGAAARAGGSHGGAGWLGSAAGGWSRTDLTQPGSVFDSLRDPSLPGGGGGSPDGNAGGAGGGVIRLLAGTARVRLDGDIVANGGNGAGTTGTTGGGAGGAVRLSAARLEGGGHILATGGAGTFFNNTGGGGGGRIAVSYRELAAGVDLAAQTDASGGANDTLASRADHRAGAGTVYLEQRDAVSNAVVGSKLRVANPLDLAHAALTPLPALGDGAVYAVDAAAGVVTLGVAQVRGTLTGDQIVLTAADGHALGSFAVTAQSRAADAAAPGGYRVALTVTASAGDLAAAAGELALGHAVAFHGVSRVQAVEAEGTVRLAADDDLLLGPDSAPVLNGRTAVVLKSGARALLRGEGPVVTFTAQPAVASSLLAGGSATVQWSVSDALGLVETKTSSSAAPAPVSTLYYDERAAAASAAAVTLPVPLAGAPASVSYTVDARDEAGRVTHSAAVWPVLPNEPPAGQVTAAAGTVTPLRAGGAPFSVVVHATDREGLLRITLTATGPAAPATQAAAVTGIAADAPFTLSVPATADGSQPVVLQALIEDASGGSVTTAVLTLPVVANEAPAGSVALAAGAPVRLAPGRSTTVLVHASDPDGVARIDLHAAGAVTQPEQMKSVTGTSVDATFTLTATAAAATPQTVSVTATLVDQVGTTATTAPLAIQLVSDIDPPAVTLTLTPDRGTGTYFSGETVNVTASATDNVGVTSLSLVVNGVTTTSTGAPVSYTWTVPSLSAPAPFTITATAGDKEQNTATATRTLSTAPVPADPPPAVSFTCPGNGAVLPADAAITLAAAASDDAGVTAVKFYLGNSLTPFAQVAPTGSPKQTTASAAFNLATVTGPAVRFRVEATDTSGQVSGQVIDITLVTPVSLKADGTGTNDYAALAGQVVALRSGTLTIDQPVTFAGLIVLSGATITHTAAPASASPKKVDITVNGPLYVGCGGAIDASVRGYAPGVTYPGQAQATDSGTAGSHFGEGGLLTGTPAETFGSLYTPQEDGSGGASFGRGGGAVRISASRVQVDGAIRTNGMTDCRGGAGGSVWITAAALAGLGSLEAKGGNATCSGGSGGGGAIAVEYGSLDAGATLLANAQAYGGSSGTTGGAGTVYARSALQTYGELTVDNGSVGGNRRTILPSLGNGTAQAGSSGATLSTGRPKAIPAYFVGHWVEVRNAAGALKGTWRIAAIGADGKTVTLAADAGAPAIPVNVAAGDAWQGVYRFDRLTLRGQVQLLSTDPIRVVSDQVITGSVETDAIHAGRLVLEAGASLTQHLTASASSPASLLLDVGELVVRAGAVIDVSGRGYPLGVTYPGQAQATDSGSAGSHLGEGGTPTGTPSETFGSVYYPQENGAGSPSYARGGGAVRITANRVQMDGVIRTNGATDCRGGGGGSVWITSGSLAGVGSIEAKGGNATCSGGSGGGGAISVEYGTLEAGATILGSLQALGGSSSTTGGAGTVLVRSGAESYGELTVDNGIVAGNRRTILPPLGGGTAQAGSSGSTLVTGRPKAIPAYFVGHWVEVRDGAGTLKGTWRIASIGADGLTVSLAAGADGAAAVAAGDAWQGVYRFDRMAVNGQVQVLSSDPIRVLGDQVITGNVETDAIHTGRLVLEPGALLTQHFTPSAAAPASLWIDAAEVVVKAGAAIDVSGRGYAAGVTYPGHALAPDSGTAGSHLGEGGVPTGTPVETFGSVYRPQENGSGGASFARGGGTVRMTANRVQIDGVIRTNGATDCRGGAGGSVWITATSLAGTGSIEAKGGNASCTGGSGGGGAIAVEYGSLESGATLLGGLQAAGGSTSTTGGAGTVFVRSGSESYGELTVDNGSLAGNRRTILPSLGSGSAQPGSGGATLVTGRPKAIPAYFTGHWVEVRNAAGTLKGTWRIASIGTDGFSVTLAADAGGPVTVAAGDAWQGVYRFDFATVRGQVQVLSADPIRVVSDEDIAGTLETDAIHAGRLIIEPGAVLTQHFTPSAAAPASLSVDVGELVVKAGGAIDVSGHGYPAGVTYPGHAAAPDSGTAGSHLGEGGVPTGTPVETFGSVYRPQENGSGGASFARGGGAVHITAASRVQVDGVIRTNGATDCRGGAGGSVWITTTALAGLGSIEAKGGNATCSGGSGGGGAIAVEYAALEPGAALPGNLSAYGGSAGTTGGAGTVYVRGGAQSYGELTVDNGTVGGNRRTILPSLGSGAALAGSNGAVLVTGRAKPVPAYFAGHWVEVRDAAGNLKGTWRVSAIGADGLTVTLASNAGEAVTVAAGDAWQGVYRFDRSTVRSQVQVLSADPMRVVGDETITGTVETDAVYAGRLVIESGAVLTQHLTPSALAPASLAISVDELVVKAGGSIDVSGRGYPPGVTYPGQGLATDSGSAGSHLGEGGTLTGTPAETFGSVTRPQENGSGGASFARGGGAVRITAASRVQVDGAIRTNGATDCRGGAGGSVWITTASLAGLGSIEAKGGTPTCSGGSGGGGAIAVEYGTLEPGATLLGSLQAYGGATGTPGGAGTVLVRSGAQTFGSLTISNGTAGGTKRTILPSLGSGTAQAGSGGAALVTDRAKAIPAYFLGHWVDIKDASGVLKGTWRIASIAADGVTVTLSSDTGGTVSVAAGDKWQGTYRVNQLTVASSSVLVSNDPVVQLVAPLQLASAGALYGNAEAPVWNKSAVSIAAGSVPGSYRITVGPAAVDDPDGISEVRLTAGGGSVSAAWSRGGVSFFWAGRPGQRLQLVATDAHRRFRRSAWLALPPLPAGGWEAQPELAAGVTPLAVVGGADWLAIADSGVWLYGKAPQATDSVPPRAKGEEVAALAAGEPLLFAATRDRVDLLDRAAQTLREVPMPASTSLVALAPAEDGATLLISDTRNPARPVLRLMELQVRTGEAPALSTPGEQALPPLADPVLVRTAGYLHLFGRLASSGEGVILSWPSGSPQEALSAAPQTFPAPAGAVAAGAWEHGAILLDGAAVRLYAHDDLGGAGWSEVSHVDLPAAASSAAVAGDSLVVVLPGEVRVYEVSNAAAPVLRSRHPGSSYRQVTPLAGGEVLLWSPRMATPPLRWNPATAVPGDGFHTVIDGLP